jgi:hypothetical protein
MPYSKTFEWGWCTKKLESWLLPFTVSWRCQTTGRPCCLSQDGTSSKVSRYVDCFGSLLLCLVMLTLVLGLFVWNSLTCTLSLQEGRWIVTSTKHDFYAQQLQMMSGWTELIDTMMNPASLHLGFRVFFQSSLAFHMVHAWEIVLWWTQHYQILAFGLWALFFQSSSGFLHTAKKVLPPQLLEEIWTSAQQGLKIMQRKLQILC